MFQKIWQVSLLSGIIFYAGNIFFAPDSCARVEKSGSVVRVFSTGLFFLTDNWLSPNDRAAARTYAHDVDTWVQDVVRVTFFGRDLKCAPTDVAAPISTQDGNSSRAMEQTKKVSRGNFLLPAGVVTAPPDPVRPPVVNTNPYNLPSLPESTQEQSR